MKKVDWIKICLPAIILLLVAAQKGGGSLLVLLLPLILLYAFWQALRLARRPAERRSRLLRLGVWAAAFVLAGAVQLWRSTAGREAAAAAAEQVVAHAARFGAYPASLKEIGLDEASLRRKWGIRYALRDGRPHLALPAAILPMTMLEYDFASSRWRGNAY